METPKGNGKIADLPAEHHKLGKLLFCWVTPTSTKILNGLLIVFLLAAFISTAYLVATARATTASIALPWALFVFYLVIWVIARTPTGNPCGVYEKGITDKNQTIFFTSCKLALEATRHLTRVARSGEGVETGSSYEIRIFEDEMDFIIKGWDDEYRNYYIWFRDYLVPLHLKRDKEKLEKGETLTVGQFKISTDGISHAEEGKVSWEESKNFKVQSGEIIVGSLQIPLFVGGAHVLLEILHERAGHSSSNISV